MSIDAAPHGQELVFDLLGDLYLIPTEGGVAQRLLGGVGWDHKPEYSPNGEHIAFISDRDGGWNLWRIDADGTNLVRLSHERFAKFGAPTWTPDGDEVVVAKTYTDRTLGAPHLYRYPVSGGKGTVIPTNGPAWNATLSPTGQILYYTRYGLYGLQLMRLNLSTGRSLPLTPAAGDCGMRPASSPRGTKIAYACRKGPAVRLLWRPVTERGAGDATIVYTTMGASSAYGPAPVDVPGMTFGPNGERLYFSAGGQIRRAILRSGHVEVIPLHADVYKSVVTSQGLAVTVPGHDLGGTIATARTPLWVAYSPDRQLLAATAFGKIFIVDIVRGRSRRLTRSGPRIRELTPAFSRDGRRIVYTTWSEAGSQLRVASVVGGDDRVIMEDSARLLFPSMAPDGASIAVIRLDQGGAWRTESGPAPGTFSVVRAYARDGEVRTVARGTTSRVGTRHVVGRPTFGQQGKEIYFSVHRPGETRLYSVDAAGQRRLHLRSTPAAEVVPSPSGRWAAVAASGRVYVVPLVGVRPTGLVDLRRPDSATITLAHTRGAFLQWLDEHTMAWCIATRCITQDSHRPQDTAVVSVTIRSRRRGPDGFVALTGGRVVTMSQTGVIDGGTVLIEGNIIRAVGPSGSVEIPREARVIDVGGLTVIPGLIDTHAHLGSAPPEVLDWYYWKLRAYLGFGVTTIFDPQAVDLSIFSLADLTKVGVVPGPRIVSTGAPLYGPGMRKAMPADYIVSLSTRADAHKAVKRAQLLGASMIKVYGQPRRDHRQWLASAAARLGLRATAEGACNLPLMLSLVLDGYAAVEHSFPRVVYEDVMKLMREADVSYTPTLTSACGSSGVLGMFMSTMDVKERIRAKAFLPERFVTEEGGAYSARRPTGNAYRRATVTAANLARYGVTVTVGGHGNVPGLGTIWEAVALESGGLSPVDVIQAATLAGAEKLGLASWLGSVEVGKLADLVVVGGDPTRRVRDLAKTRLVIKGGIVYDAKALAYRLASGRR